MTSPERREARSAATRLAVQFTAVILVLFAVLGFVVYAVVSAGQAESAKRTLADASMVDSVHDAPRNLLITVISPQGTDSSPGMPDGLPDQAALSRVEAGGAPETSTIQADGISYLTVTDVRRGKVVQISYSLAEQQEELNRLVVALVISGIVAAVAAAFIAVFIARRAMRPLADALALQRRFVADASHELRTPLTLLSTRAQLVRRRARDASPAVDQEVRSGIDEIVDDSKALTEIVEDLLIAADPRQATEAEQVDLGAVAAAVARAAEARAVERGVRIETRGGSEAGGGSETGGGSEAGAEPAGVAVAGGGAASTPAVVSGAPVSLRRMVVALVDNAVDHAASRVLVETRRDRGSVILSVSDDGPGFADGADRRVFERFASSRATDEGARHYGLGLALVAEVVERHRGTVAVSNDGVGGTGAGGRVTVRLPASPRG
ncbi:sensor histidine kinase [Leifsonia sp. Root227]|uniref:sensor histidine kinase n=1 Tax=Leifsonia sp. Root227 TaxID=1736496 RepID=UPI000B0E60BA|nr:HAMP domain-containing sensor histidine kinase [Leifsonia sp. Root227]